MKTKENQTTTTTPTADRVVASSKQKPKSLRPMRSMVSVRSLRPSTAVAAVVMKSEATAE